MIYIPFELLLTINNIVFFNLMLLIMLPIINKKEIILF
jgi:hypothetical protein